MNYIKLNKGTEVKYNGKIPYILDSGQVFSKQGEVKKLDRNCIVNLNSFEVYISNSTLEEAYLENDHFNALKENEVKIKEEVKQVEKVEIEEEKKEIKKEVKKEDKKGGLK